MTSRHRAVHREHKYGAQPTEIDGIRFASKKEAKRYGELKLLVKAGEINRLQCQPSFDLTVIDMSVGGRLLRAVALMQGKCSLDATKPQKIGRYVADFSYWTRDEQRVIEDVKGFKTPLYKWKKKHVMAQYGIEIREV